MRRLLVPIVSLALGTAASPPPAPDRAGWLADFETARQAITRTSPNLEWQAERGLDLAAIEGRARARLAAANTPEEARDALRRFLRPFADGHMELSSLAPASERAERPPTTAPDCAALGIEDRPDTGAIASRLAGYRSLAPAGAAVPAGVVEVKGHRIGVLRIAMFAPSLAHCRAVLSATPPPANCDEQCRDTLAARIDDMFLAEIATRLRALRAARPEALLVDLADNGGGNDTAIAIARMLGGADVPTPALALTRTPATVRDLTDDLADLDRALITRADRQHAAPYRTRLVAALAEARQPCDLAPLFQGRAAGCTNLIRQRYAGGTSPLDLPAADRDRPWAELVSATARYHFQPAHWPGPLFLLVDGNSASATELLVAMLKDANRAIVIGAPTFGAGCGFTRPPQLVALAHLGLALSIPDCARFRRDGTNEIDAIVPDVLIPFREFDTPRQRAGRLLGALPTVLAQAAPRRPTS